MRPLRDGTWLVMRSLVYLGHSMRMCILVPKSVSPQGQAVGSFGKNLALYSPMGACPRIVLDALAHRVTE